MDIFIGIRVNKNFSILVRGISLMYIDPLILDILQNYLIIMREIVLLFTGRKEDCLSLWTRMDGCLL